MRDNSSDINPKRGLTEGDEAYARVEAAEAWAEEDSLREIEAETARANREHRLGMFQDVRAHLSRNARLSVRQVRRLDSSPGELIREARLRAFMTQKELAEASGTTQAEISLWETGKRLPSILTVLRLIGATGHDLDVAMVPTGRIGRSDPATLTMYPATLLMPQDHHDARRMRRRKEIWWRRSSRVGPHTPR